MPTDNHGFKQPPRGQTEWDLDWYHNFDTLDERVVARGVQSNRSNYTPYENTLYLATDTENIFRGTGSGWEQLQSFGVNPDFGQASADKVVLNNAPVDPNDAVRLQDIDSGGSTEPGIGGTYSTTGDGTSTTFSWDTGVSDASAIEYVSIDPSSRSASTDYTRFIDGTSIGVEYDIPPNDGAVLSWFWTVNATVSTVEAVAHDHTGDTLNPTAVNSGSASVSNAPSAETDVARQAEISTLDSSKAEQSEVDTLSSTVDTKADLDGGGTASLSNYASVDTDELNSTIVWADPSDGEQGIQDANDALVAQGGGVLALKPGTYTINADNLFPTISSNVHVVGAGIGATTLRLADGTAQSGSHVLRIIQGTSNASIRHLSVDGNYQGNDAASASVDGWGAFAHGISVEVTDGSTNTPQNIYISNVEVFDTIRSGIVLAADHSVVQNAWLSNSIDDHPLYISDGNYSFVDNLSISGFWARDAISVSGGTSGTAIGNVLQNITIEDGSDTPSGATADRTFYVRPSSEGTTIENVTVRNVTPADGLRCDLEADGATLDNYDYRGPGGQNMIDVKNGSQMEVLDPKIHITATNGTGSYGIAVRDASDVVVRGGRFYEAANTGFWGLQFWAQNVAMENVRSENYRILQAAHGDYRLIPDTAGIDKAEITTVDGGASIADAAGANYLFNGIGQEAAGAGVAPTAANWWVGAKVENTDDSTMWIKDRSGAMVQIA